MGLVRPGGLILVDNTLWKGRVADPDVQDADTCAIRDVNTRIFNDARVDVSVNPVGTGRASSPAIMASPAPLPPRSSIRSGSVDSCRYVKG